MYGRASASGGGNALQEISNAGGVRICKSHGVGAGGEADGIFSEQDEIDHGGEQGNPRKIWRASAAHDGRDADAAGGGAKDGERGAGHGLRNREWNRGGHACNSYIQPTRFDAE